MSSIQKATRKQRRSLFVAHYLPDFVVPTHEFMAVPVYYERLNCMDAAHEFCVPVTREGDTAVEEWMLAKTPESSMVHRLNDLVLLDAVFTECGRQVSLFL